MSLFNCYKQLAVYAIFLSVGGSLMGSSSGNDFKGFFRMNSKAFCGSFNNYETYKYVDPSIQTTSVFMGNGDVVTKLQDKKQDKKNELKQKKSIFSFGFAGCTGTAIYVLLKNGEQRAALTHYSSDNKSGHIAKIKSLCKQLNNSTESNEIVKVVATIFHPFTWKEDTKKGYTQAPRDLNFVRKLDCAIKASFNQGVEVSNELYDEGVTRNGYHPYGMHGDKEAPKELEIVLCDNQENSYVQTKATWHKQQKFSEFQ